MGIGATSRFVSFVVGSRDGNFPYLGCWWIEGWEFPLPRLLLDRGMGLWCFYDIERWGPPYFFLFLDPVMGFAPHNTIFWIDRWELRPSSTVVGSLDGVLLEPCCIFGWGSSTFTWIFGWGSSTFTWIF